MTIYCLVCIGVVLTMKAIIIKLINFVITSLQREIKKTFYNLYVAVSSLVCPSWWPPGAAGLVCSCLRWQRSQKNKIKRLTEGESSSSCSNNLQQHYTIIIWRHSAHQHRLDYRQPACHYTAPLLGGIKISVRYMHATPSLYTVC